MQRLRQIGREACRAVLVAGTLAAMVSPGWAQTARPSPRPVGKVAIDQAQVAFIGSASCRRRDALFPRALLPLHDQ